MNAAPNQLYLGVKVAAALQWLERQGLSDAAGADHQSRFAGTMADSWLGDHYPIYTGRTRRPRQMLLSPHPGARRAGADAPHGFSNYLAHGLVPLLWSGWGLEVIPHERVARHLLAAHRQTRTPFGDAHRDGHQNVWVSQNLWRDAAALFLEVPLDYAALAAQYWRTQALGFANRSGDGDWEAFCDSPLNPFLTSYPRGAAVLLHPWAERGITWNDEQRCLTVRRPRGAERIALPFLADWETDRVPSLEFDETGELIQVLHPDLLDDAEVRVRP